MKKNGGKSIRALKKNIQNVETPAAASLFFGTFSSPCEFPEYLFDFLLNSPLSSTPSPVAFSSFSNHFPPSLRAFRLISRFVPSLSFGIFFLHFVFTSVLISRKFFFVSVKFEIFRAEAPSNICSANRVAREFYPCVFAYFSF